MKRRLIQLCAALLYNLNLKGFAEASIYKGKSKGLCVPRTELLFMSGGRWILSFRYPAECPVRHGQEASLLYIGSSPALWGYHGKDHMRFPLSLWPGAGASL